jgi:hypothetical protein
MLRFVWRTVSAAGQKPKSSIRANFENRYEFIGLLNSRRLRCTRAVRGFPRLRQLGERWKKPRYSSGLRAGVLRAAQVSKRYE